MPDPNGTSLSSRTDRRTDRLLFGLAALAIAALFGFRLYQFWVYTVDDAFITLRYARNVVEGWGLVYNPGGPRVEGYTNPLLLLFQIVVLWLRGDALLWTKLLGAAAGFATLAGSALIALDLLRRAGERAAAVPRVVCLAGTFLVACAPLLSTGCISGLETSLFAALLTWGTWGFLRVFEGEGGWAAASAAGALMGLAAWTRPEGIAWAGGLAGLVIAVRAFRRRPLRAALLGGFLALGLWLALIAFRLAVFGDFQPNTYYAKMGGAAGDRLPGGIGYLRAWAIHGLGIVPLILALLAVLFQPKGRRGTPLAALLAVAGFFAIIAWEGGDWIPYFRLLTPAVGVLGGLASAGLALLLARLPRKHARPLAAVAALLFCLAMWKAGRPDLVRAIREIQTRVAGWNDAHRPLGEWLGDWRRKRGGQLRVAIGDIGLVGWFSRATLDDLAGLTDRDWARRSFAAGGIAPYPVRELLLEKKPEAIVLIATARPVQGLLEISWQPDRQLYNDPEFVLRYRHRTVFTHKDFPGDGYYLHVFLRRDVFDEAPPVTPPVARATGGWE